MNTMRRFMLNINELAGSGGACLKYQLLGRLKQEDLKFKGSLCKQNLVSK